MAPLIEPDVIVLYPWEVFTAIKNGQPCIGARLWTFAANTTTPKAAFHDAYFLNPHPNPIVMNDQGQAVIWLDGFYHLRLEDAEGVLLWDVESFEFAGGTAPPATGFVTGMTEGNAAAQNGAGVLSVQGLIPVGYRVEGIIARVDTAFGASNALTGIAIGDAVATDRWGSIGLDAVLSTSQPQWHAADRPIAVTTYTVLLSAIGGTFDTLGAMTLRGFWSSITGWS